MQNCRAAPHPFCRHFSADVRDSHHPHAITPDFAFDIMGRTAFLGEDCCGQPRPPKVENFRIEPHWRLQNP